MTEVEKTVKRDRRRKWKLVCRYDNGKMEEICIYPNYKGVELFRTTNPRSMIVLSFLKKIGGDIFTPHRDNERVAKIRRSLEDKFCEKLYISDGVEHRTDGAAQIIRYASKHISVFYYIHGEPAKGPFDSNVINFCPDGTVEYPELPEGKTISLREAILFAPSP